jgi:hypothetical protein
MKIKFGIKIYSQILNATRTLYNNNNNNNKALQRRAVLEKLIVST